VAGAQNSNNRRSRYIRCSFVPSSRDADCDFGTPEPDLEGDATRHFLYRPIRTPRLTLILLPHSWLVAFERKAARPDLGFVDPYDVFVDDEYLINLRRNQIEEDKTSAPWLLRAVVLISTDEAVGTIGFHGAPDERGMVEIGYSIHPSFRRRGLASEAAEGMWQWAAAAGARILRASISPDNEPSLALVRHAGFVHVGEQYDERDGLELIFEHSVPPQGPR
jgi:[ribosomal protein S5]-alanine N-acetyltransferase